MNPDNSQCRNDDIPARVQLMQAASKGKLSGLRCPNCENAAIEVYFTSRHGEYQTWFECSNCDFSMRAQNSSKPEHYEEARDRSVKQATR
jgi:predicted RNA-binding Zn-ribbon protein involved in translation (DUF1610 family)